MDMKKILAAYIKRKISIDKSTKNLSGYDELIKKKTANQLI